MSKLSIDELADLFLKKPSYEERKELVDSLHLNTTYEVSKNLTERHISSCYNNGMSADETLMISGAVSFLNAHLDYSASCDLWEAFPV